MNELVALTAAPSNLVGMVADARTALANASGAAEVLDTIDKADFAYEAARLSRAKDAHDEINASMNRVQADALEILALAKRRLADEYDAAQSRGEIATKGGDRKSIKVLDENSDPKPATVAEIGLTKNDVFEARQVRDAIEAQPDLLRSVLDEMLDSGEEPTKAKLKKALAPTITRLRADATAAKKERRVEREIALGQKIRALPAKKFGVIWADPEWRFEPYSRETGMDRAPDNHYPTSETDDICARDVGSIAADDCVLFLWATAPMLLDAIRVMEAWGFGYKTNVVWVKERMGDAGGTGYWFLNDHEHLLVGTRGNAVAPAMGTQYRSVITARVGEHSEKPEIFLEMVEDYFPNLPKIELNRRGAARPGWDAWGLEATVEDGQIDEIDLSRQGPTATPPEGEADAGRPFDQLTDSVPDIDGKPVKAGDFVRPSAADAPAEPFEVRRVYKNGGISISNQNGHQRVLKAGQFIAAEGPKATITPELYDQAKAFMATQDARGLLPNIQDIRAKFDLDWDTGAKLFDAVIDGKRPEVAKREKAEAPTPALPPAPGINAPVEFTVGGLKKNFNARFSVRLNADGTFDVADHMFLGYTGHGGPPYGGYATYRDALEGGIARLRIAFHHVLDDTSSPCGPTHKAVARAGLKWLEARAAEWGLDPSPTAAKQSASPLAASVSSPTRGEVDPAEPGTIDLEEWIESKAAHAIPAPTEDELIEYKMLGAIEAGLVVGGDMFDAFVERGLVFVEPDGEVGVIELSPLGALRSAALERMVKAHSDGDAVRCAPEGGAA